MDKDMQKRLAPIVLWVATWSFGWWIGIAGIVSLAINDFYSGPTQFSVMEILEACLLVWVVWIVLTAIQAISLSTYRPQTRNSTRVAWISLLSIGWSSWWTGLMFLRHDAVFRLVFIAGWLLLGGAHLIFVRKLLPDLRTRDVMAWIGCLLLVIGLYVFQDAWDFLMWIGMGMGLPGISAIGLLYGGLTGLILDRAIQLTQLHNQRAGEA